MGFLIELHGDQNLKEPTRRAASRVNQIFSDFFRVLRDLESDFQDDAGIELVAMDQHLGSVIGEYESFRGSADSNALQIESRISESVHNLRTSLDSSRALSVSGVSEEVRRDLEIVFVSMLHQQTTHVSLVESSIILLRVLRTLIAAMLHHRLEPVPGIRAILTVVFMIQILMTNIAEISARAASRQLG
jgi:hypothetical protein